VGEDVSLLVWIGVVLLGGIGSAARLLVDGAISSRTGRALPFGTLVVNVSGSLLLGLIAGLAVSPNAALLAGTAAVGSYTTFSTWMFETQRLGEDRQGLGLAGNILVSLVLGIAAAAIGRLVGGLL
jgi:CrcB protein